MSLCSFLLHRRAIVFVALLICLEVEKEVIEGRKCNRCTLNCCMLPSSKHVKLEMNCDLKISYVRKFRLTLCGCDFMSGHIVV